jgi:CHC2 zinc finger
MGQQFQDSIALQRIREFAAADFVRLFDECGGRRRGRGLFCPFHPNHRTPAASIYGARFHCFACGLDLDAIGFLERVRGQNFREVLDFLGARYGVPILPLVRSTTERQNWAVQQQAIERDLPNARLWKRAALELCDEVLDDCKERFFRGFKDVEAQEIYALTRFSEHLRKVDGRALAEEWISWKRNKPELTSALVRVGRALETADQRAVRAFLAEG